MRRAWPTCEDVCAFLLAIALLLVSTMFLVGCGGGSVTGPSSSGNQAWLVGRAQVLEAKLGMGRFQVFFAEPPSAGVAGWALCGTGTEPWKVGLNEAYVETADRAVLEGVLAHEMCHHYVDRHGGSCRDEWAAELCAFDLTR